MNNVQKPGVLLSLFLIVMIVSASAGYLYQSSKLKPVIETMELENAQRLEAIQRLNASLQYAAAINHIQNSTISSLEAEKATIQEQLTSISQQLSTLLTELEETKQNRDLYKTLSKRFYETNPIRIGVTSPTSADEKYVKYLVEKAEFDIHRYCVEQDLPYRFDFVIGNNLESMEVTLSNMINYDALGINLIVGHFTDSQCSVSLNYANNNDMILISPGSSSPKLAIKDDNLFRLAANETLQLDANIAAMKSMDIQAVVVFSVNSDWGKSLLQVFTRKLSKAGIELLKVEYYPDIPNVILDSALFQLSLTISNATATYGKNHVALQIFSSDRVGDILTSGRLNGSLKNIIWFGTEDNAYIVFTRPNEDALRVLLLSPVPVSKCPSFSKFNREVSLNYGFNVTLYGANIYDACWQYALTIIETGNTNTQDIKEALPIVARDYMGVTGDCSFNAYGDRYSVDYNLMGYWYSDNKFVVYGYYDSSQRTVEWQRIHPKIP